MKFRKLTPTIFLIVTLCCLIFGISQAPSLAAENPSVSQEETSIYPDIPTNIPETSVTFDENGESSFEVTGDYNRIKIEGVGEFVLFSDPDNTDSTASSEPRVIKVKQFYDPKAAANVLAGLTYQGSFTLYGTFPHIIVQGSYWASPCVNCTVAQYTDNIRNYYTVTRTESWWERDYSAVEVKNAYYSTGLEGLNQSGTKYSKHYISDPPVEPFEGLYGSMESDIYISTSYYAYSGWNPARNNGLTALITHKWTGDLYWYDTFKKHVINTGGIEFYGN